MAFVCSLAPKHAGTTVTLRDAPNAPVKITGSVRYTLLDPLCTEAEMMWELTTRLLCLGSKLWPCPSPSLMVEFWVERKEPRFLYRESTSFTWPAEGATEGKDYLFL
uniref:Uncharacterized protein n=1 Tax=Oryzias latipes TaxID=8090 RepID=A0A3P9IE26_ORYLA